jgi:hypothetical protein
MLWVVAQRPPRSAEDWDGFTFDFSTTWVYTTICQTKAASRLRPARGDDQDGKGILVADIVAQSPPAVRSQLMLLLLWEVLAYQIPREPHIQAHCALKVEVSFYYKAKG